jgi:recombination protein RecT
MATPASPAPKKDAPPPTAGAPAATTAKPGTAVAVPRPADQMKDLLGKARTQLEAALPGRVDVDRFIRIAVNAVLRTPLLLQCDRVSLLQACMQAAQLGLDLDGVLGHAYLVPFRVHGRYHAVMIPGYRGYIVLAHRSGRVSTISPHVVHEKDRFRYQEGTHRFLDHVPSDELDPGKVTHAYVVIQMTDGKIDFEVMNTVEIEKVRASSQAADKGPWVTHWDEMAKKTVIRRKAKTLPLSAEWQRAALLDEYADAGIMPQIGSGADPEDLTALATATRRDELAERYKNKDTPDPAGGQPPASESTPPGAEPEKAGATAPLSPEELARLDAEDAARAAAEAAGARDPGVEG